MVLAPSPPADFLGFMSISPIAHEPSRPLDVHRWSDHPQVHALTDDLWLEVLPDYDAVDRQAANLADTCHHTAQFGLMAASRGAASQ